MVTSSLRPKSRFMRNAMNLVCDTVEKGNSFEAGGARS